MKIILHPDWIKENWSYLKIHTEKSLDEFISHAKKDSVLILGIEVHVVDKIYKPIKYGG